MFSTAEKSKFDDHGSKKGCNAAIDSSMITPHPGHPRAEPTFSAPGVIASGTARTY